MNVRKLRQGEEERGSLASFRFNPHLPTVVFDDLPADGQADTGSLAILVGMQALEYQENAVADTDAVITH
jgi:hypothetical protein